MLKHKISRRSIRHSVKLPFKKVLKEAYLYAFPVVCGLEDISSRLNSHPAENMFNVLLHGFSLRPIKDGTTADEAERMIEYLDRAFENKKPPEVEYYCHLLLLMMQEFDKTHHIQAAKGMLPCEILKAFLTEDNIPQKSLVPDCFRSESQVSEFLHQKKGRQTLTFEQAAALAKRFKVSPLIFLQSKN